MGAKLGLEYSRTKRMSQESLLDDMVHVWLRKDDNVTDVTWHSLVTALESLGHNGIASSIKKGKWFNPCAIRPLFLHWCMLIHSH